MDKKLIQSIDRGLSRRSFLVGSGTVAAATVLAGCGTGTVAVEDTAPISDIDIINFALQFEYFGAEYYLNAATGSGLSAADAGAGAGTVMGASQVTFATPSTQAMINLFAQDELNHVRVLRAALTAAGSTPQPRPTINYTAGFNAVSSAAGLGASFNPFDNEIDLITGAFSFEDIDVTAYTGAAPLLTSPANLDVAAGIQAVEAYHAGAIRTFIAGSALVAGASQAQLQAAQAIQTVRANLGGGNETTLTSTTIVNANPTNAIGYGRTTDQVLHIVYGTTAIGATGGGFFPNGINGRISAITS